MTMADPTIGHADTLEAHEDGTQEWLDQRNEGIGGSDAPRIVGIQPYGTDREEIWRLKTGRSTPDPWAGGAATSYGHRLEPHLRQWLIDRAEDTPSRFGDFASLQTIDAQLAHPDRQWQRANVDGVTRLADDGEQAIVELKTSTHAHGSYEGPDWREDGVRRDHWLQIQHYLAVTGLVHARYVYMQVPFDRSCALQIDERFIDDTDAYWRWVVEQAEITIRQIIRDQETIDRLTSAEADFWACVQTDTVPDPWVPEGTATVSADSEIADLLDQYGKVHARIKAHDTPDELEEAKERAKAELKDRAQVLSSAEGDIKEIRVEGTDDRIYWHGSGYWRADPADREPTTDTIDRPF